MPNQGKMAGVCFFRVNGKLPIGRWIPHNQSAACLWIGKPIHLLVPKRISATDENVLFHIHPKGNKKVDDYGAAKGEKGQVNKVHPDFGAGNIELLPDVGANAKGIHFYYVT